MVQLQRTDLHLHECTLVFMAMANRRSAWNFKKRYSGLFIYANLWLEKDQ